MNKNIIKMIFIVNVCVLTSCAKMESENAVDTVNEEEVVSQTNESDENVEVNANYINDIKPSIRKKNESSSDIIPIKKDEFGENIVLEKYNYYFSDSEIGLNDADDVEYLIDIDIYFPQITIPNDKDLEAKINENLKIPLLMFGENENERIADFDSFRQIDGVSNMRAVYSSYDILFLSEDYLSINYIGSYMYGKGVAPICFLATIDLNTGEFLLLDEVFDLDSIESDIKRGEYTLFEGAYQPGFGTGYEDFRKDLYIESLNNGLENYKMDKDKFVEYSPNSFVTNGTFLYIYASDDDTLNGYFVLRFWLSDVTSKIEFDKETAILRNEMKKVIDYY